jgi:hypothetical protein
VTNLLVQLIDFSSFPDFQTQFTRLRLFHFVYLHVLCELFPATYCIHPPLGGAPGVNCSVSTLSVNQLLTFSLHSRVGASLGLRQIRLRDYHFDCSEVVDHSFDHLFPYVYQEVFIMLCFYLCYTCVTGRARCHRWVGAAACRWQEVKGDVRVT